MEAIRLFKALTRDQRNTFLACFLGWALDALDFFLLTFVFAAVAQEFGKTVPEVTFASMLTLMFRPLGALLFGFLGEHRIPRSIDGHLVFLFDFVTRMGEALREVAIVGE